ncbi:type IV toxin-antitoxin system AbiEi family antitoxin [uncultured Desulfosarcina sp.]|uniref:type IV toxin-antitoxin system AbiEi family antitoxin n=1 Tax=uncultured Desulfosarcina sp. TaxID=218289 RepID=UPI0029C90AC9|nr:type IV toxin-antitoxin system AbiEi family antitoxin [uncultured Desulfosarcina sp.]
MKPELQKLINAATELFAQTTGIGVVYKRTERKENQYPNGCIRINHEGTRFELIVQAKRTLTRATVLLERTQPTIPGKNRILITTYVTPPLADLMKKAGIFFMDTAGNAYIDKPPLFVFVKGNRPPDKMKRPPTTGRVFKPAGLKVLFTLLNAPGTANLPYRQIAEMTDVALGTVEWIFRDLKEMGFLIEMDKRERRLTKLDTLQKRWVEAYPDQLRPKLVIDRFNADNPEWWKTTNPLDYDMHWGGEVAAAKLTQQLRPEKVIIYGKELPGKLIIKNKLRKTDEGKIEILKPFWKFEDPLADKGIVPPLLIYADLMATGDERNIETAGILYDTYLA